MVRMMRAVARIPAVADVVALTKRFLVGLEMTRVRPASMNTAPWGALPLVCLPEVRSCPLATKDQSASEPDQHAQPQS